MPTSPSFHFPYTQQDAASHEIFVTNSINNKRQSTSYKILNIIAEN